MSIIFFFLVSSTFFTPCISLSFSHLFYLYLSISYFSHSLLVQSPPFSFVSFSFFFNLSLTLSDFSLVFFLLHPFTLSFSPSVSRLIYFSLFQRLVPNLFFTSLFSLFQSPVVGPSFSLAIFLSFFIDSSWFIFQRLLVLVFFSFSLFPSLNLSLSFTHSRVIDYFYLFTQSILSMTFNKFFSHSLLVQSPPFFVSFSFFFTPSLTLAGIFPRCLTFQSLSFSFTRFFNHYHNQSFRLKLSHTGSISLTVAFTLSFCLSSLWFSLTRCFFVSLAHSLSLSFSHFQQILYSFFDHF